jgi:hypothetical protein
VRSTMAGLGKVEVEVYEGIFDGKRAKAEVDWASSFKTSFFKTTTRIKVKDSDLGTKKKNIRSTEGHHKTTGKKRSLRMYRKGPYLYTITLHYCATPGLIAVGVLPKLLKYLKLLPLCGSTIAHSNQKNFIEPRREKRWRGLLWFL